MQSLIECEREIVTMTLPLVTANIYLGAYEWWLKQALLKFDRDAIKWLLVAQIVGAYYRSPASSNFQLCTRCNATAGNNGGRSGHKHKSSWGDSSSASASKGKDGAMSFTELERIPFQFCSCRQPQMVCLLCALDARPQALSDPPNPAAAGCRRACSPSHVLLMHSLCNGLSSPQLHCTL